MDNVELYDHVAIVTAKGTQMGIVVLLADGNARVLIDNSSRKVLVSVNILVKPNYKVEKYEVFGRVFDTEDEAIFYRKKLTFITFLENGGIEDSIVIANFIENNIDMVNILFNRKGKENIS